MANRCSFRRPTGALPTVSSNTSRTWNPNHGIVFNNSSVTLPSRPLSTLIIADTEQDILATIIGRGLCNASASETSGGRDEQAGIDGKHGTGGRDGTGGQDGRDGQDGRNAETVSSATSERLVKQVELPVAPDAIMPQDPAQNELPQTTIAFKMSEEVFRAAKNAEPGSSESFWTLALYRGPGVDGDTTKVMMHYCKNKEQAERELEQHFSGKKVLGFDIEWKADSNRNSGPKKNVSLIQIASDTRVALIQIALFPGDKPEDLAVAPLKRIMEDPSITKVGVAIKGDCTRLRKHLGIESRGIFELSHLYKLVKCSSSGDFGSINKRLVSLATQVQEHLHLPLFKGEVRGSDWSLPLAMDQIVYAASDAYAAVHLFDVLEIKRKALNPVPPRPYHAEEDKPIRTAEGVEIPTDDEADAEEPEPPAGQVYKEFSSAYLADAEESLEIDPEEPGPRPKRTYKTRTPRVDRSLGLDPDLETSAPSPAKISLPPPDTSTTIPAKSPRAFKSAPAPTNPLIISATLQAEKYRSTHHQNRASLASLRCYFLWHDNPNLLLEDIGGLLREVPLQTSTVVTYILDAIQFEKLPNEKTRLQEVMSRLPEDVISRRYKKLANE